MAATWTSETWLRELASRTGDGICVVLLWSPDTGRVYVRACDSRWDEKFELEVPAGEALRAFHHPYAYAARRGYLSPHVPERESVHAR
jgi:hypothetical protein